MITTPELFTPPAKEAVTPLEMKLMLAQAQVMHAELSALLTAAERVTQKQYFTANEAATYLGYHSRSTVDKLRSSGKLPACYPDENSDPRFRREDLDAVMQRGRK